MRRVIQRIFFMVSDELRSLPSQHKYAGNLLIKLPKETIKSFLEGIREIIKTNGMTKTEDVIRQLNTKLQGLADYSRHVVAKKSIKPWVS